MRCLLVVINGLSTQVINKPSALNVALSLHYYSDGAVTLSHSHNLPNSVLRVPVPLVLSPEVTVRDWNKIVIGIFHFTLPYGNNQLWRPM